MTTDQTSDRSKDDGGLIVLSCMRSDFSPMETQTPPLPPLWRTYGLAKLGVKTQPKLSSIVCAAMGTISTNCKTVRSAGNLHKSCSEWSRSLTSETWPKQGHCVRWRIHMAISFSLSAGVTSIHSFIHSCRFENRGREGLGGGTDPPTQENRGSASLNCKAWLWRWGSCNTSADAHTHTLGAKGS